MKVLHVIDTIARESGGPARSCQGLVAALCGAGVDAPLLSLTPGQESWHRGVRRFYSGVGFGKVLNDEEPDIVHVHGLWRPGLHNCAAICRQRNLPYVISPRGMLDPWALKQKQFRKRIARFLYQDKDINMAAALHATAESEAAHIHDEGFDRHCIVVPNGVDIPDIMPPKCDSRQDRIRKAVFLSRLHPGKGLLALAEAWSRVKPAGWQMEVIGPDSYGHKAQVVAKLRSLGIEDRWHFSDMLNDDEKWQAYRSADILIHPSISENFGITIAEGLAAGLPVIATRGTPWRELEELQCGWWIDYGVETLAGALREAVSLSDQERADMGERGKKLIEKKYTWGAIGRKMAEAYELILRRMEIYVQDCR